MNVVYRQPTMTREQFFAWAEADGGRWEFDGFQPVAMTGGTANHGRISGNLYVALRSRLRGTGCEVFSEAGVATIGDAVRYPDALVTCSKVAGEAHTVPGVVIVFEILSPTSGRVDRIEKVREYKAVPSIRCYVIVEHGSAGLTVLRRDAAEQDWTTTVLTGEDTLQLPEIGIEIPVSELYESVDFPEVAIEGSSDDTLKTAR